jgi:hypothetical protein
MVSVAEITPVDHSAPGRAARWLSFLRRHRVFAAAFGVGAVLRLITMLGYGPAMWFNDSYEYVSVALHPRPHPIRPDGYSFWLMLLKPFHSFALVTLTAWRALRPAAAVPVGAPPTRAGTPARPGPLRSR